MVEKFIKAGKQYLGFCLQNQKQPLRPLKELQKIISLCKLDLLIGSLLSKMFEGFKRVLWVLSMKESPYLRGLKQELLDEILQ